MTSRITVPNWGPDTISSVRDVVRNNERVYGIDITILTDETWLPLVLSQVGLFASNSEVRRNRPELWRDVQKNETIKFQWGTATVIGGGAVIRIDQDQESEDAVRQR